MLARLAKKTRCSRPATPPGAVPITRTFAARDDLVEWTRKIASIPPEPDLDANGGGAQSAPSAPPVVDTSEPATRALPRSPAPAAPSKPFPWALAGSSALLLSIAALVSLRGGSSASPGPIQGSDLPAVSTLAAAAPSPLTSAPASASALAPVAAPSAPSAPPVRSTAPSYTIAVVSASAAATPDDVGNAQLRLTADPQATVTIVGARVSQTHVTPVRGLKLEPGVYSVTFRSPTFGEPVVARVELAAGGSRSVHADFRAAIPTVVVR
jgi:hypothetical protein